MSTTMSDPVMRSNRSGNGSTTGDPLPAPGERLAPPPKYKRRPALIAASAGAICLGALGSVAAYNSSSTAQDILAVRQTVERGQIIGKDDLMTVRISVDPALKPMSAADAGNVIGKHAAMDMPAGGVVTAEQVTSQAVPAKGHSVVGISLTPAQVPSGEIKVGDPVRVITTPDAQAGMSPQASPDAIKAVVVGLATDATTGNVVVNVQVPHASAPAVAAQAATGKVAIVLDSREG